jgi:hypothetical protein
MSTGKKIGNINLLDLRKATPESVAEIAGIGNVNVVMYTPATAGLLAKLNIGNLNAAEEVPAEAKIDVITGQITYKKESFENLDAPSYTIIIGQAIVEPGVTAEAVLKNFSGIAVVGQLVVPEALLGAFQSKLRNSPGQLKSYPVLKQIRSGSWDLNENALRMLADGSEITLLGRLNAADILPNDLLERKIARLFALEGVNCREENAETLKARLVDGSGAVKAVPAGFEVVEQPLRLDATLLENLPSKKLYCKERVLIDAGVSAGLLDASLEALRCEEMILAPVDLKSVLARKINLLRSKAIFYEGLLYLVEDAQVLQPSYFESVAGKVTLVVTGELTVDPALDGPTLTARLARVHNFGAIRCTPAQMGAIQACLGSQEGALVDSSRKEEPAELDENFIGNANYLAL